MPNIEIKAAYSNLQKAREICKEMKASFVGNDRQIDTYFNVPNGRLKLRNSSLSGTYLIPYIRPNQAGPKKSDYARIDISEPDKVKSLFVELMGVGQIVAKTREIYLIENVRVHLDSVDGVGTFFELEAVYEDESQRNQEEQKVKNLMEKFEISTDSLQQTSYQQMAKTL